MTKVAVVLSGCGFRDGSEVHEATLALYFLDRAGAQVQCFAPDKAQQDVVDHSGRKASNGPRNVLAEAARIARGRISDVAKARAEDFDALVMPGGFGAAKNLSNFATAGADASVDPHVTKLVREMHAAGKPIGAICIAPAVVAAAFRGSSAHPMLTIGDDPGTAAALKAMGAEHASCPVDDIRVDAENRVVSTPAYMYDARISQVGAGVEKLVAKVLEMAREGARSR